MQREGKELLTWYLKAVLKEELEVKTSAEKVKFRALQSVIFRLLKVVIL